MYFMSVPAIYCNCMYFYVAKSSTAYANTDLAQPLESLAEVEGWNTARNAANEVC